MRREFSATVKAAAFTRAKGLCGECHQPLQPGRVDYDHILPCALGGKAELANCRPLCTACHKLKTSTEDVPRIRKADRQGRAHINAKTAPTQQIANAPMPKAEKKKNDKNPLGPPRPMFR
jgi:5-methylcytosine-specific restriction protein A